jgi:hypothetical protein
MDGWGAAYVLNEPGQGARRDGQVERAQQLHEESLDVSRPPGSRMGIRAALMNLALATSRRGDVMRSAMLAGEALQLAWTWPMLLQRRRIGLRSLAWCLPRGVDLS